MAVAAFGAISASSASAAEYHCGVAAGKSCWATLTADGTGKTSHHVFIVEKEGKSGSVTCNALDGRATAGPTSTQLTFTHLEYTECNLAGTAATIDTKGCDYLFTSNGGIVHVICEAGSNIQITAGECTVTIGSQERSGITYTNINSKKEVTASTNVTGVTGTAGAGCSGLLGFTGAFTSGTYTTGNTIVKGFEDLGESETKPIEGAQVNVWWE